MSARVGRGAVAPTLPPSVRDVEWREGGPAVVRVEGEITERAARTFEKELTRVARTQPMVLVYVHSQGGCMYSALRMVDCVKALRDRGVSVHTSTTGCCMSAALTVFCAGQRRFASENSTFMVHPASWSGDHHVESQIAAVAVDIRHTQRVDDRCDEVMRRAIRAAGKEWKGHGRVTDYYMDARKARACGIATDVAVPEFHCDVRVEYRLRAHDGERTIDLWA